MSAVLLLNQTLPEKIAATLAERITAGFYRNGERLVEATLAKELSVSHGPIRDALRILHNAGLVTIHPYRGASVTEFSEREIQELYQVRAALVGLRARWLAEDPGRGDVLSLVEPAIGQLAALAKSPSTKEAFISAAIGISETLTTRGSNRWLRTTLQALNLQTSRYTRMSFESAERRRQSSRAWMALLEAMRAGKGKLAQELASSQSLATRDAALESLQLATGAVKEQPAPATHWKRSRATAIPQ